MNVGRALAFPRLRIGACLLFLVGAWVLFFWPILVEGRVPVFRDILDTTVPFGEYIGARLREGKLPQWFPYEGLGEPFIGNLNESTFHPARWLFAVLPATTALRWEMLLGYLAGAIGQFLLARKLGMTAAAAALAAAVFAFSGYTISLSNLIPYLWGMASLPWLGFFAAQIYTRERPWPWIAPLSLCWATMVLAGDSHSALLGGLVVFFVGWMTGGLRRLPICVLGSVLALGLAGAELLPAIDIVREGPRTAWAGRANIRMLSSVWALHPYRFPELLFPNWLPQETLLLFSNVRYREAGVWAISVFAGVPCVVLAATGMADRRRRGLLAGAMALFALWIAMGLEGHLEPLLRRGLPFLNVLRYPEKNLEVWTLGLALAAAAGFDRLRSRPPRWTMPALLALLALACALAALLLPQDAAQRLWPQLAEYPAQVVLLHAAWRRALLATAVSLAAFTVIVLAARRRREAMLLLPLALFLELWVANGAAIGVAPARTLVDLPRLCVSALRAGAGIAGTRAVSSSSRPRTEDEKRIAGLWVAITRNLLQPDANTMCGIPAIYGWPGLSNEPRRLRSVIGTDTRSPILQLYGFGLAVRAYPEDRPFPDEVVLDSVDLNGRVLVLVKRPAAPRAWAATPRWVQGFEEARIEVQRKGLALVDEPVLIGPGKELAGKGRAGAVEITTYQPEQVVLEARMDREAAVILNDLHAPGWSATVDGAPAPIYQANALVRGVLVPAGAHRIEMSYQLPRLRAGLRLSGGSLLLCALLGLTALWRRRRRAGADELQRAYWANEDRAHYLWQTGNPYIAATESELLEGAGAGPGERLLEIGCGEGANLRNLGSRAQGAALFGVDFSLAKARFVAGAGVRSACADATRLPFRDASFDAVLVRDLLHHVVDRPLVLREASRVLKPGGRLTLIEPIGRNPIIAAMALAIPAERGMLRSSPRRALSEAQAEGFIGVRLDERQPLPLSRVVLHYRLGAPGLARSTLVRSILRALERAARVLPRSVWSYFVLTGRKP